MSTQLRPIVYLGAHGRIPTTPGSVVRAAAPLTIHWGRRGVFSEPEPTVATIVLHLDPAKSLPAAIKTGTWCWITVPAPADAGGFQYVFTGTIRDIALTAPTARGRPVTVTVTATDDLTTLRAARLYQLPGGVWRGTVVPGVWPAESAIERIRRIVRAADRSTAEVAALPDADITADARALQAAKVRAVGNSDKPSEINMGAWEMLTETLTSCACTLAHTPIKTASADRRDHYTLVPWGEGQPPPGLIPTASIPATGVSVSTSLTSRTDLIECAYYPHGETFSGDVEWGLKETYKTKILHPSPAATLRLTSGLKAEPNGQTPAIDRLLSRATLLISRTTWDLSQLAPRLTQDRHAPILTALIHAHTRPTTIIALYALPRWLGLPTVTQTVPLGGALTWDGHSWAATLTLTPRA